MNMPALRTLSRVLLLGLVALITASCGGGGGSTFVPLGVLVYTTDWTNSGAAGGGVSQRISVLDLNERTVKSLIANKSVSGDETYRIENIASGTYVVRCELFSQVNLGGVKTGEFEVQLQIMDQTPLQSRVGAPVTSVSVSPLNVTAQVPKGITFHAAPIEAGGRPTFAPASSIAWSVLGGVGTITTDGTLITSAAGNGTVRARHVPTGNLGSAVANVSGASPTTTKWTIFVFLNAANDLYAYSALNMNQMEKVAGGDVRFVVQWKQSTTKFSSSSFDGTRRYLVKPDSTDLVNSEVIQNLGSGVDMGKPDTLKQFLDWGKTYYPAQRYGVVVWNHGNGWRRSPSRAVSYDDETGNAIQIWQLDSAFSGHHFDFLAWDASLMQMAEVAYEVRGTADYIVGSEESPPAEGYPYDTIFAKFRDTPDASTRDLTKAFVDGMLGVPSYASRKITQSVLDTSKLAAVGSAINTLAQQLMANSAALASAIPAVRNSAQPYSQTSSPPRYYRDAIDMCEKLEAQSNIASVDSACQGLKAAIQNALVWEGHNSFSSGSRGLSIDFTPGTIFLSSATDYGQMKLGKDTLWDDWLVTAP